MPTFLAKKKTIFIRTILKKRKQRDFPKKMNFLLKTLSESSSESDSDNSEQSSNTQADADEKYKTILTQILKPMITLLDSYNKFLQGNNQEQNTHTANTKQLRNHNCSNYENINTPCNNTTNYTNLHSQNNWYPTNYSANIVVSQDYILNNAHLYGEVIENENEYYITIKLYRRKVALTLEEIEISQNILHPIDIQKQSMYRCPLSSCQHKPLNNIYIRTHIQQHCHHYHFNDKKNYCFLYQINEEWKSCYYPPHPMIPWPTNQYNQDPIDNDNNHKNPNPTSPK